MIKYLVRKLGCIRFFHSIVIKFRESLFRDGVKQKAFCKKVQFRDRPENFIVCEVYEYVVCYEF
jgi:hypothetical protein